MGHPAGTSGAPGVQRSGHERMVNGRAAASGEKSIGFSARIAWFGDILNRERDRSSRSGPVRSLSIQSDVRCEAVASGGGSVPGLNPLVLASWSVGAGEQWPGGCWGHSRFPAARKWVALPLSARIRRPDGGKTP